jgi:hypothetical protein
MLRYEVWIHDRTGRCLKGWDASSWQEALMHVDAVYCVPGQAQWSVRAVTKHTVELVITVTDTMTVLMRPIAQTPSPVLETVECAACGFDIDIAMPTDYDTVEATCPACRQPQLVERVTYFIASSL